MADERILVVDDEIAIRDTMCTILEQAGFHCHLVTSGSEALEFLRAQNSISIVLSDLIMEGMDGITLLARMKQEHPEIPVVMVTAVQELSVALMAIRNGAYDYLLKPFERDQLLAMVRRAIETRHLRLENLAYQTKLESLVSARTDMLRKTLADLERSYDITLEALGDALDLKDAETEGHSRRVTAFTIAIARAIDLPQDRVRIIARGAFLHDIGKMAIPDAILRKPGRLTAHEQAKMREHAYLGYKLLRNIPFLQEAADIVYSHQERYDGSGYPRGLKADQIPLGARIFAIADTFDAMTSDRPYRAAQSISSGRREIERNAGKQFDPEIVKTFLSVKEHIWQELRNEIERQSANRRFGGTKSNAARNQPPNKEPAPTAFEEPKMSTVLSLSDLHQALQQLPGWKSNGNTIERELRFDNFVQAMEFVNRIAEAADAVDHHPDIIINYNTVTLKLVSHDSGGVTQRDIKMAARINELSPP